MDKIQAIQMFLREEIERTENNIEDKARCKFYKDAALLQERKQTLDWVWNLVSGFADKKTEPESSNTTKTDN